MATSLPHTCEKDANEGVIGLLSNLLCSWCIAINWVLSAF